MKQKKDLSILSVQSLIVDDPGSYMDYRDYILAIVSNPALVRSPLRINIVNEKGKLEEFSDALTANGFKDFVISRSKPTCWSDWMLKQIEENNTKWVMPFPGDHVYLQESGAEFTAALEAGVSLSADAIVYGHICDFESFLDWRRLNILYRDDKYILFEWGTKWRGCHDKLFQIDTHRIVSKCLSMPSVPGFCIYSTDLIREILRSMPSGNYKWHQMEQVKIKRTESYRVLLPRKLFYYHVHGYWVQVFRHCQAQKMRMNYQDSYEKLLSLYIPTEFDWRLDSADSAVKKYRCKVTRELPEVKRILAGDTLHKVDKYLLSGCFEKSFCFIRIWFEIICSKIYFFAQTIEAMYAKTK